MACLVLGATLVASFARATTPRIVAGSYTSLHPGAVALLYGADPESASMVCSGVLIGCRTVLTAAHCVCPERGKSCRRGSAPDPGPWSVFFQHAGLRAVAAITVHPNFDFPIADVALVTLADPIDGVAPVSMARTAPPLASVGTIVGFGNTGLAAADFGLKREGQVRTSGCGSPRSDRALVCWEYAGTGSDTCVGDSGGPLLVAGAVAGITSGGTNDFCEAVDLAYDANIATYRDWILESAGIDVTRPSCGLLPAAGGPETTIVPVLGSLDEGRPTGRHRLPIPPGSRRVLITMNAQDDGLADFDLAVSLDGTDPAAEPSACVVAVPRQYAVCEFERPEAEVAEVAVVRRRGAGPYQVTMTTFADVAAVPRCTELLDVERLRTEGLFSMRAGIPDPERRLAGLDPRAAPFVIGLDDGVTQVETGIPAGDSAWRPTRDGFRWQTASAGSGIVRVILRRRERAFVHWEVRVVGRDLGIPPRTGSASAVRLVVGGRCFTGQGS